MHSLIDWKYFVRGGRIAISIAILSVIVFGAGVFELFLQLRQGGLPIAPPIYGALVMGTAGLFAATRRYRGLREVSPAYSMSSRLT